MADFLSKVKVAKKLAMAKKVSPVKSLNAKQSKHLQLMNRIIRHSLKSSHLSSGESHTILTGQWELIKRFFAENQAEIDTLKLKSQAYGQNKKEDRKTNKACKAMFKKFRTECMLPMETGQIDGDVHVPANLQPTLLSLMRYMQEESMNEGGIVRNVDKTPENKAERIHNNRQESKDSLVEIMVHLSSGVMPGSFPGPDKVTAKGRFVLQDKIAALYTDLTEDEVLTRQNKLKGDFTAAFNQAEAAGMNHETRQLNEAFVMECINNWDEKGEATDSYSSQEANLDRIFHFCYILWKCDKTMTSEGFTANVKKLASAFSTNRSEVETEAYLKAHPDNFLKRIVNHLDDIGRGGTRHKFQCPMMITLKRFLMGLCSFVDIPFIGQILNRLAGSEGLAYICAIWTLDAALTERANERSAPWLLHNLLKGAKSTFSYCGEKTGNVLKITMIFDEAAIEMPIISKEDIDAMNFSGMTDAQMKASMDEMARRARADQRDMERRRNGGANATAFAPMGDY